MFVFVFNVPTKAKVIWRQGHSLASFVRLVKPNIEIMTPGFQSNWYIHYTTAVPIPGFIQASLSKIQGLFKDF